MGKGIDMARAGAPAHAQLMEDFRDQLLIVLLKRLADASGKLVIPVAETDDTAQDLVSVRLTDDNCFEFTLSKKE